MNFFACLTGASGAQPPQQTSNVTSDSSATNKDDPACNWKSKQCVLEERRENQNPAVQLNTVSVKDKTEDIPHQDSEDLIRLIHDLTAIEGGWWSWLSEASAATCEHLHADYASIFVLSPTDSWATIAACAGLGATAAAGRAYSSDPQFNESSAAAVLRLHQNSRSQALLYRSVHVSTATGANPQAVSMPGRLLTFRDSGDLAQGMEPRASEELPGDWQLLHEEHKLNHFAAVGLCNGNAELVGVLSLAAKGSQRPTSWTPEALHCAVGLMSPHIRRAQTVLVSGPLSALHAAATFSDLVTAVAEAAVDVAEAVVHVRGSSRVAFIAEGLATAAVFQHYTVERDTDPLTPLIKVRRSSCDFVSRRTGHCSLTRRHGGLAAAASSSNYPRMSVDVAHGLAEGNLMNATTTTTNMTNPGNAMQLAVTMPENVRQRSFLMQPSTATMQSMTFPSSKGTPSKGHTLTLQRTLLGEALSKEVEGLCIDDCQAYTVSMKAYPRDLLLSRGAVMPLSLALASNSGDTAGPKMALYITFPTRLPRPLLQAVVQELQQLLQALMPILVGKLTGSMWSEYDYLSTQLQAGVSRRPKSSQRAAVSTEQVPADTLDEPQSFPPHPADRMTSFLRGAALGADCAGLDPNAQRPGAEAEVLGPPRGEVGLMDVVDRAGDRPASQLAPVTPLSSTHGPTHGLGKKRTGNDGGEGATAVHNGDVPIAPHSPPDAGNGGSGACPRSPFIAEEYALEGDIDMELAIRRRPVSSLVVPEGELPKLRCNSACEPGDGGVREPVGARLRSRLGAIRSVSFRLEAAQAPRGASKLAPIIASMHDRLQAAQAVQMSSMRGHKSDLRSLRILQEIGYGGYGTVYRGTFHGTEVAVKVIRQSRLAGVQSSSNILASGTGLGLHKQHLHDAIEVVASVSMSHINIVQVPAYFMEVRLERLDGMSPLEAADKPSDSRPFQLVQQPSLLESPALGQDVAHSTGAGGDCAIALVLEFCDCGSLCDAILNRQFIEKVVAKKSPLDSGNSSASGPAKTYLAINMRSVYATLLEIALALRHMHQLALVHCDLKPQNVLLKSSPRDPRGFTAKLSDFGLAKMMAHDDEGQLVIDEAVASGTITHVAPEVLLGQRALGASVDIYAFGILMYQGLCGMKVYDRVLSASAIAHAVAHRFMRPQIPSWVPQSYRALAQACWHHLPSARPTADELVCHLEKALEAKRRGGGGITAAAAATSVSVGGAKHGS